MQLQLLCNSTMLYCSRSKSLLWHAISESSS